MARPRHPNKEIDDAVTYAESKDWRWNKLTVARGCYWKKCSFCDVSLDYIGRYDKPSTDLVVERIRSAVATTTRRGRASRDHDLFGLPRATIRRNDSWVHFVKKCLVG